MHLIVDEDYLRNIDDKKPDYSSGVILPDGSYMLLKGSHLQTLFLIAGKPEKEIWEMIPSSDSPLFFMIAYTHCVITDKNSTVGLTMNEAQEESYRLLVKAGVIEDKFFNITNERRKKEKEQ